jgi:hypothetical protein
MAGAWKLDDSVIASGTKQSHSSNIADKQMRLPRPFFEEDSQ